MFEKFIEKYFSENSFLELINACFNEAGIYFGRNTLGGMKSLISKMNDDKTAEYIMQNKEAMLEETTESDCFFIVAMPMAHQAFPAPYRVIVDQCMGEVTFLCGFERVFREREEKKKNLTEKERDELTAVIKILACAARASLNWGDKDSIVKFLSSKDDCDCLGYDIIQYFKAYHLGFCSGYLKNFLDCAPLIKDDGVRKIIEERSKL